MKKNMLIIGFFAAIFLLSSVSYGYSGKHGAGHDGGFKEKLGKKFHLALAHQEELDLSDEQVAQIKAMKIQYKKDLIQRSAEVDLLKVDIMSQLHEDAIDTAAVDKLIDQKYEIKKSMAKSMVGVYAKFKGILKAEQMTGLKKICMAQGHKK